MENLLDAMTAEAEHNVARWQDRLNYLRDWKRRNGPTAEVPENVPPGGESAGVRGRKIKAGTKSPLTISDAIRFAVKEKPRTSTEVADRVQEIIPAASRYSITDIVFQLMRKGEFHKGDDLKLYVVRKEVSA